MISVVIPVKDNLPLTRGIVGQLHEQGGFDDLTVFDNGSGRRTRRYLEHEASVGRLRHVDAAGFTLHQMWNRGADLARARDPRGMVAFLNNDLRLGPGFLAGLSSALGADAKLWAVSPNYDGRSVQGVEYVTSTYRRGGLAGFAFMVKAEAFDRVRFDERFEWWFGDDDLVAQIESLGYKVGIAGDVAVEHIAGGSQTVQYKRDFIEAIRRDRRRMADKWGFV